MRAPWMLLAMVAALGCAGCAGPRKVVRATPMEAPRTGDAVRAKAATARAAAGTVAATAGRIAATGTASGADLLQLRLEAEQARDMVDALSASLLEHELNWSAYSKRVEEDRALAWGKVEDAKDEVDRLHKRESRRAGQVAWAAVWGWWVFAGGCLLSRAHPSTRALPAWWTGAAAALVLAALLYLTTKGGSWLSLLWGWLT